MNQLFLSKEQRANMIEAIFNEWPVEDKNVLKKHLDDLEYEKDGVYILIKKDGEQNRMCAEFGETNEEFVINMGNVIKSLKKFKIDNTSEDGNS